MSFRHIHSLVLITKRDVILATRAASYNSFKEIIFLSHDAQF
jgi:hypothetical protein